MIIFSLQIRPFCFCLFHVLFWSCFNGGLYNLIIFIVDVFIYSILYLYVFLPFLSFKKALATILTKKIIYFGNW